MFRRKICLYKKKKWIYQKVERLAHNKLVWNIWLTGEVINSSNIDVDHVEIILSYPTDKPLQHFITLCCFMHSLTLWLQVFPNVLIYFSQAPVQSVLLCCSRDAWFWPRVCQISPKWDKSGIIFRSPSQNVLNLI